MKLKNGVVWITGLSGSGKSTLANNLTKFLKSKSYPVLMLDGDELRSVFGDNKNFDYDSRLALSRKYSKLCKIISEQNFLVVIATISMFSEIHRWNRKNIKNYLEVYLKVPLSELKKRDSKKIYSKFYSGKLKNVAGLDLPVEEPKNSDLFFNFDDKTQNSVLLDELIKKLEEDFK